MQPTTTLSPVNHKALIALCYREKTFKAAMELAKKIYQGDKRADRKTPFLAHPLIVASVILETDPPVALMTAAVLQDALARGKVKEATLRAEFGADAADAVVALTPVHAPDGSLDVAAYGAKLQAGGAGVQSVKLASMLHSIVEIPFAKLAGSFEFLAQCDALLPFLAEGSPEIARRATLALRRARA